MSYKDLTNEDLMELYQKKKEPKAKEELTMRYIYLVKAIAAQMKPIYSSAYQIDEIVNEGVIEIMSGIDRYDPKHDSKFETFISKRIRGMIIDLVRRNDWLPHNFRKQYKEIEEMESQLRVRLGRPPGEEELAKALNLTVSKLRRIKRMSVMMNVLSLDLVEETEDSKQSMQLSDLDSSRQPEKAYLEEETRRILSEGIQTLKEKEKLMLSLYYVEELNMKQIARIMHISEPRVSQIHSSAVRRLKEYMDMRGQG